MVRAIRRRERGRQGEVEKVDSDSSATDSRPRSYLKVVDRLSEQLVSAYLGFGLKIIVVHTDAANDEGVAAFCTEAHELYCKVRRLVSLSLLGSTLPSPSSPDTPARTRVRPRRCSETPCTRRGARSTRSSSTASSASAASAGSAPASTPDDDHAEGVRRSVCVVM